MINNYDNASTVSNEEQILRDFQARSLSCYRQYSCICDVPYASSKRTCLDLFKADLAEKTVVFIHGGYWQWCDKSDFAFIVPHILKQRMQCVLLEYGLAPQYTLSDIVTQVKQAIDFIVEQDWMTQELILVGHSAGAHLAALMLDHPRVNQAVLLSGIYDLDPIQHTPLNQALQLSQWEIDHLSPIYRTQTLNKRYDIYCGGEELETLQAQSKQYFQKRHVIDGEHVKLELIPKTNHYTILEHYFKHYLY